jgi:hypothetical protein
VFAVAIHLVYGNLVVNLSQRLHFRGDPPVQVSPILSGLSSWRSHGGRTKPANVSSLMKRPHGSAWACSATRTDRDTIARHSLE